MAVFPSPITSTTAGSGTTPSITMPLSTEGDLLIAWIQFQGGAAVSITPPAGWTLVRRENYLNELSLAVYSRNAASSEPATYDWTLGSSQRWVAGVAVYNSTDATVASSLGRNDQYSVRLMPTLAIATTKVDSRIVAIAAQESPSTWTAPAGWTLQDSQNTGSNIKSGDIGSAYFDLNRPTAGTEPAATLTAAVGSTFLTVAEAATPVNQDSSNNPRNAAVALGLTETVIPQTTVDMATPGNARDLVLCLAEVGSGQVNTKLNNLTTGVYCQEMFLVDDMQCASSRTIVNPAGSQNIDIDIPAHPAAGGLVAGNQQVYTDNINQTFQHPSGTLATNLELVATIPTTTNAIISAIEQGSTLLDASTLTSRRVFLGLPEASQNWNETNTQAIMQAGMDWCIRGPSSQCLIMLVLEQATSTPATIADLQLPTFTREAAVATSNQAAILADLAMPTLTLVSPAASSNQTAAIADLQLPAFTRENLYSEPPTLPGKTVSGWLFEDGGNLGLDTYGSNNGAVAGEGGITPGIGTGVKGGNAADSSGSLSNIVIPDSASIQGGQRDFTFSLWVKTTDTAGTVAAKNNAGGANREYGVFISASNNQFHGFIGNGSASSETVDSGVAGSGQWQHVLLEYETSTKTLAIEVDGFRITASITLTPGTTTNSLCFFWITGNSSDSVMVGSLDNIYFFDSLLTNDEKAYLRAAGVVSIANPPIPATVPDLQLAPFQREAVSVSSSQSAAIADLQLPALSLEAPAANANQQATLVDLALPAFSLEPPSASAGQTASISDLQLPSFSILENVPATLVPPAITSLTILEPIAAINLDSES